MLCQECKEKQATVHMTKIINGHKSERHLCEDCAKQQEDFTGISPFSVNDLIASFMDLSSSHSAFTDNRRVKCPVCNMDYYEFKKSGLFGCRECYKQFSKELAPILRKIQGSTEHSGKIPKRSGTDIFLRRQIRSLKEDLKKAVQAEAFEEAARLRDQIRELEKPQRAGGEE